MQFDTVVHALAFVVLCYYCGFARGHGQHEKNDDVIKGVTCYVCDDCAQPFQPSPADQQSHCAYCGYASKNNSRITRTCFPLVTNAKGKVTSRPTPPYDDCYSDHRSLIQCYCRTEYCNLYTGPPASTTSSGNKWWTPLAVFVAMLMAAIAAVTLACTVCKGRGTEHRRKPPRY